MKMVAMVGSLRENSYNAQLVNTMAERYQDVMEISLSTIGTLPHYNQDDESNPPEVVRFFKSQIDHADAVLIATPEFNWSIPGVLKNALDWLSRGDKVLINKPLMIMGASTGMVGTLRAQLHLRQMLASPGLAAKVLPANGNEILINFAEQKFSDGQLRDEPTLQFLDQVMKRFVESVKN